MLLIFLIFSLSGLGAGLITTPGVLIVSLYFEKRRALASAICVSGNALGGFFLPPVIEYLLEEYGLRGTLLLLSAMQLHVCAASCLYRPIGVHAIFQERDRLRNKKGDENENLEGDNKDPSSPQLGASASEPNTPLVKSKSIFQKVVRSRMISSSSEHNEELRRQVSFLRSSSMMNSIPDLTQYARSWSIGGERSSTGSRSSINRGVFEGTGSRSSLFRYAAQNECHSQTPIRLSSEDEGRRTSGEIVPVSSRRSLQRMPSTRGSRVSLVRQASCRNAKKMSSLPELDADSQCSLPLSEPCVPVGHSDLERKCIVTEKLSECDENELEEEVDLDDEQEEPKSKCSSCFSSLIDVELMTNSVFLIMAISVSCMAIGAPHAIFFLPAYTQSIGLESAVTALLSISSIVDLFGRLGIGFLSDLNIIGINKIYVIRLVK